MHVYTLTYTSDNIAIDAGRIIMGKVIVNVSNLKTISVLEGHQGENLDYLWIKTLGPFSKWEHKYIFSQNGDIAMDIGKTVNSD